MTRMLPRAAMARSGSAFATRGRRDRPGHRRRPAQMQETDRTSRKEAEAHREPERRLLEERRQQAKRLAEERHQEHWAMVEAVQGPACGTRDIRCVGRSPE
ncbi:hypothetical protein ACLBWX_14485 [Methylobacterium sp. M6A4_1b]